MATLYIVATPIGNLEDITLRAIRTLKEVDLILCEDTRQTRKLLDHYEIQTKTMSYHQHSGVGKVNLIMQKLRDGANLALVTDAGTPAINDPGVALVHELVLMLGDDLTVSPIPGPSAVTAILSASGLPSHDFRFLGFLPHKKGRETMFELIRDSDSTTVCYESTHRISKTLKRLTEVLDPMRQLVVGRELTKKFETIYRGTPQEVMRQIDESSSRGEFVIVIGPRQKSSGDYEYDDSDKTFLD